MIYFRIIIFFQHPKTLTVVGILAMLQSVWKFNTNSKIINFFQFNLRFSNSFIFQHFTPHQPLQYNYPNYFSAKKLINFKHNSIGLLRIKFSVLKTHFNKQTARKAIKTNLRTDFIVTYFTLIFLSLPNILLHERKRFWIFCWYIFRIYSTLAERFNIVFHRNYSNRWWVLVDDLNSIF